jgi:hypothetical protein
METITSRCCLFAHNSHFNKVNAIRRKFIKNFPSLAIKFFQCNFPNKFRIQSTSTRQCNNNEQAEAIIAKSHGKGKKMNIQAA